MRIAYETMLAEFERVLTKYGISPKRAHEAAEIFAQNSLGPSALPALVPWSAGTASAALAL